MANPRIRGKIPHAEWPKIAQRFTGGESLTAIARDYQCTAPAIRYIVRRTASAARSSDTESNAAMHHAGAAARPSRSGEIYPVRRRAEAETPIASAIWSRVNSDITNFLAAVDALFAADTGQNRNALLGATDRLLRASARTRMELEHIFGMKLPNSPAKTSARRKAG